MASVIQKLVKKDLIRPPSWLAGNTMFEGQTGSVSYGAAGESSDIDVVGFCMPTKELLFPHLTGEIPGFGKQIQRFQQYQQHHVDDKETGRNYDLTIYSIVRFFQLCMDNNPNMIDALFLDRRNVLHSTQVYEHVRNNRKLFLHKGSYHKFRGYCASQMSKIVKGTNKRNPKRQNSIDKYGYDVKFAYHCVRLLLECEQILETHDLNLSRDSEIYKSIRRGEWSFEKLKKWHETKDRAMEELYNKSTLRHVPDEEAIKQVLIECIEMHYGSLSAMNVKKEHSDFDRLYKKLADIVEDFR